MSVGASNPEVAPPKGTLDRLTLTVLAQQHPTRAVRPETPKGTTLRTRCAACWVQQGHHGRLRQAWVVRVVTAEQDAETASAYGRSAGACCVCDGTVTFEEIPWTD
jgi:hypothetical protein